MKVDELNPNKKYILACSFGPDSMALFYLLESHSIPFEVAHVNYHLRPESDKEQKKLEKYCKAHHKVLHVKNVTEKITGNVESRCREIRYNFFAEIYYRMGYEAVLVAHQQDDLIETYILQKNRQNLPKYFGISWKTDINWTPIIRPCLEYTKKDLLKICKDHKVPYAIDKSNLKDEYARNKIRHEIVEKMSQAEKDEMLKEIERKNAELVEMFSKIDYDRIDEKDYLLSLEKTTYLYTINRLAEEVQYNPGISEKVCMEIRKVLLSQKPNIEMHVKGDLFLHKEYNEVYFRHSKNISYDYKFILKKPGILDTEYFHCDFRGSALDRNVRRKDFPLTIRNAKKDDKIMINGYEVEVRRLFIDWKLPMSCRGRWPVICDRKGNVLYVPRYRKEFVFEEGMNFYAKIA